MLNVFKHASHVEIQVVAVETKKEIMILAGIILAVLGVWIVTYFMYADYMFWSGIAGVITVPLLLVAMMVDVGSKD